MATNEITIGFALQAPEDTFQAFLVQMAAYFFKPVFLTESYKLWWCLVNNDPSAECDRGDTVDTILPNAL